MQIGKPLRTFIVEPLESPVPATAPDSDPDSCVPEPEPIAPTHEPDPEHEPVTP